MSVPLNYLAKEILTWAEDKSISLRPQFIMGKRNVIADSLSRSNQVIASEWTLRYQVWTTYSIVGLPTSICPRLLYFSSSDVVSPMADLQSASTALFACGSGQTCKLMLFLQVL